MLTRRGTKTAAVPAQEWKRLRAAAEPSKPPQRDMARELPCPLLIARLRPAPRTGGHVCENEDKKCTRRS
jgi:hypothetical protein